MEHNFKWKNDGRTKVMIGCGTRPEIIRLAAVIKRCREYFDCCVVYYNQNWDRNLSTVFWEDFELKNTFGEYGPDILVPVVGENLGVTCGNILGRSYEPVSYTHLDVYKRQGAYIAWRLCNRRRKLFTYDCPQSAYYSSLYGEAVGIAVV